MIASATSIIQRRDPCFRSSQSSAAGLVREGDPSSCWHAGAPRPRRDEFEAKRMPRGQTALQRLFRRRRPIAKWTRREGANKCTLSPQMAHQQRDCTTRDCITLIKALPPRPGATTLRRLCGRAQESCAVFSKRVAIALEVVEEGFDAKVLSGIRNRGYSVKSAARDRRFSSRMFRTETRGRVAVRCASC
jgi:hypothetical protein